MKKLKQTTSLFISMMLPYVLFAQTPSITEPTPTEQVVKPKEFLNETIHNNFYLITPSAFGLKKKQMYYKNTLLLYNGLQYGVTNNLSLGVNTILPFVATANVKLTKSFGNNIHIAGGVNGVYAYVVDFYSENGSERVFRAIIPYVAATFGNQDRNLTIGLNGSLSISGQIRFSEHFLFITEHFFLPFSFNSSMGSYMASGAVRYMKKRFTFDMGLIPIANVPIPILSATFFF